MDKNLGSKGRLVGFFLASFLLFVSFSKKEVILAEEKNSRISAIISLPNKLEDKRRDRLQKFLEYHNSPLAPYSHFFVEAADRYSLDWKLLSSIAGVESGFGKQIPFNSFNAYGWNNGNYHFKHWQDGIETVSKAIKENYVNQGAKTVAQIGVIYAASLFWTQKVNYFMKEIENFNHPSFLQFSL